MSTKKERTPEEIARILRDAEKMGVSMAAKVHNVSKSTIYRWRKKWDGMSAEEIAKLKDLERDRPPRFEFFEDKTRIWLPIWHTGKVRLKILRGRTLPPLSCKQSIWHQGIRGEFGDAVPPSSKIESRNVS